jgi:SAM-dependent methyltransferase
VSTDRRNTPDSWSSGNAYDDYIGRWSRLVAEEFLHWLDEPAGQRWLDVGCGTGALTSAVLESAGAASVDAVDTSEEFLRHARGRVRDARARFRAADAQRLPFRADSFDAAVSGLVLNFVPEPARALSEMVRVTRPGGIVAAYVWDYAGEMQLLRRFWDAAAALDPQAATVDEGRRFALAGPEPLKHVFRDAGLDDVSSRAIEVAMVFRDFDDFWRPFLGGQGPAGAYVASLDPDSRETLCDRLRRDVRASSDGTISLRGRAWAVRGIR